MYCYNSLEVHDRHRRRRHRRRLPWRRLRLALQPFGPRLHRSVPLVLFFLIFTPTDHSTHGLACGSILMQYWFVHLCVVVALDATVQEGDRIAQLIIEKIETPAVLEVDVRTLLFLGHRYRFVSVSVSMIVRTLTSTHAYVGSRRHTAWCGRIWLDGWAWLVVSSHCTDGLEGSLLGVLLGARRLKTLEIETMFGHVLGIV